MTPTQQAEAETERAMRAINVAEITIRAEDKLQPASSSRKCRPQYTYIA